MMRASLLLLAACFTPKPPEDVPCAANMTCPDDLMCIFGKCVSEAPPCKTVEEGSGRLTVPRLDQALVLDGDLADWPTCFVTVDETSAGLVRDLGAGGKFARGKFSLAAFADRLYVAAEVQIVPPLGDRPPPRVYENNAISVYFDGDGVFPTATYTSDAAQIVVDHANRVQAFRSTGTAVLTDLDTAATVGSTTFSIEMSVKPTTFGLTTFGAPIGFDIGLVAGDGSIMTSELVWFQACKAPACGCTNGDAAPYCDAREFGTAKIE